MTILYSNGCSYTDNHLVQKNQRYQYIIAERFGWDIKDAAIPGSCTSRIIRCTIRDCLKLLNKGEPIVALIQLTHLTRIEYSGDRSGQNSWRYANEDLFESLNGPDNPMNPPEAQQYVKSSFMVHNELATLTNIMAFLITLTAFFREHNIKYLIYTAPKILVKKEEVVNDTFYKTLQKDKNVMDLIDFNMLELTGRQAHPDVLGNQIIADYFINLLSEQA